MRYFFHARKGERFHQDKVGVELADEDDAIDVAMNAAREILGQAQARGEDPASQWVEVVDQDDEMLAVVPAKFVAPKASVGR